MTTTDVVLESRSRYSVFCLSPVLTRVTLAVHGRRARDLQEVQTLQLILDSKPKSCKEQRTHHQ